MIKKFRIFAENLPCQEKHSSFVKGTYNSSLNGASSLRRRSVVSQRKTAQPFKVFHQKSSRRRTLHRSGSIESSRGLARAPTRFRNRFPSQRSLVRENLVPRFGPRAPVNFAPRCPAAAYTRLVAGHGALNPPRDHRLQRRNESLSAVVSG